MFGNEKETWIDPWHPDDSDSGILDADGWMLAEVVPSLRDEIINDHAACTGMGEMQQGSAKKAKDALHEALPLIEGPAVLRHGAAKDWETKEWQSFMNDDEKRASAKIRAALAGLGEGLG